MRPIDADALIDEANSDGAYGYVDAKQIADAPTINTAPVRHGRWIEKQEKDTFAGYLYSYECSECGRVKQRKEPYCPNCGAKMDLED